MSGELPKEIRMGSRSFENDASVFRLRLVDQHPIRFYVAIASVFAASRGREVSARLVRPMPR